MSLPSHVRIGRATATALAAGAVVASLAACSASGGSAGASASVSVGRSGGRLSVSVSPPTVSGIPSVSGSVGPLTVGEDVTLTGTVTRVLAPGGFVFLMSRAGGSAVAVGSLTPTGVKSGQQVTVGGTVADVDVASITRQFGGRLPADARAQLRQLKGASFVNATSVRTSG